MRLKYEPSLEPQGLEWPHVYLVRFNAGEMPLCNTAQAPPVPPASFYLTEGVYRIVQKSITPQIRQRILHYYVYEEYVDGFVREFIFCEMTL